MKIQGGVCRPASYMSFNSSGTLCESEDYLTKQIITYIGNKRSLLNFIDHLYAPIDDNNIKSGERVFYTRRNAMYIDTARALIENITCKALSDLCASVKAKYVLISFNSEGFIPLEEMQGMLKNIGKLEVLETAYNTFRACRNLRGRDIHVKEYLYLLEK